MVQILRIAGILHILFNTSEAVLTQKEITIPKEISRQTVESANNIYTTMTTQKLIFCEVIF
jgi:hypothetical protein